MHEQQETAARIASRVYRKRRAALRRAGVDCDDFVAQVLGEVWKSWPSFDRAKGCEEGFIGRIAKNTAFSVLRRDSAIKRRRHRSPEKLLALTLGHDPGPVAVASAMEFMEHIHSLPDDCRALCTLLGTHSKRATQEILGITPRRLDRAVTRLADLLRAWDPASPARQRGKA
ncbi:MAG: sigma-70 family RNA polymerase sigma factor [Phycisphaerales bacterium]|nr:sigma-70 family RNA polymerase sigma factor [Phycisphaerales bacterium]